jgi:hypothetical protein
LISGLKYWTVREILFLEVIIGISRVAVALIMGAFILSLFLAIKYGNIKGSIILDCYRYDLNFL